MAPETVARQALITMLAAEFAAEAFPIRDDKIHGSVGHSGTVLGVYPERSMSASNDRFVNQMDFVVQFYGKYDLEIDPNQTVSPAATEEYADRFRNALRTRSPDPNTGGVWYFRLERIDYVDDPTGNRTRFHAFVTAFGNNGAHISETSG